MPIRTTLAALSLPSLAALAVLATPGARAAPALVANSSPVAPAPRLAVDDLPPTCPLCGGSSFADLEILTRLQVQAAIAVALTI